MLYLSEIDKTIERACVFFNITPDDLRKPHASGAAREAKPMLWYYLIRERRIPHRRVAAAFHCTRGNVLAVTAAFAGAMQVHPAIRRKYSTLASLLP